MASLGREPVVPRPGADPAFTVVVRTQGRRPRGLRDAVASLAAQTHAPAAVLVMVHDPDPATAGRVEAMLDGADRPTGLRIVPVTSGDRAAPLNAALDMATGDYVCFLDDDDLAEPGWLACFASHGRQRPGAMVRAVTVVQRWRAVDGDPVEALGPVERPYPATFDLLAHMSRNETPICAVALPRAALDEFGLRFDESLPVFEDWDLIMRVAAVTGVVSSTEETARYRRLDHGNADTAVDEAVWHRTHARVIDKLSAQPVLLDVGDARRLAATHFEPGGGSRYERELVAARAEIDALTRSPLRFVRAFGARASAAVRQRVAARRP